MQEKVDIKDYCTSWQGLFRRKGAIEKASLQKLNFESLDFSTVRKINDTSFVKCRSDKKAVFVLSGTHLSNIFFDNFDVPKIFFYWKDSYFSNIKISGNKINYIRIQKSHDTMMDAEIAKSESLMFDLSECQTEDVKIWGVNPESIIINPDKHYAIDTKNLLDSSGQYVGKQLKSFILSGNLKSLISSKQRYGVFGKYKDDADEELEYLHGLMGRTVGN